MYDVHEDDYDDINVSRNLITNYDHDNDAAGVGFDVCVHDNGDNDDVEDDNDAFNDLD